MDIYEKLIENPLFFKWIYNPGPGIESWWRTYLEMNPDEAERIIQFKQRFKALGYSVEALSETEKQVLARRIFIEMESIEKKRKRSQWLIGFAGYAAIALIFFSTGALFVYLRLDKKSKDWTIAETRIPSQLQGPVLILPAGNSVPLKKSESSVDYTHPDKVVLNNDSVLQSKSAIEKTQNNQLIIPYGNRSKVTLSDNTVVWLNAGSRLIYPSGFSGDKREVMLFGEAFFDVTRNEKIPFVVKTSFLEVKVLGTEFDVSAYPEDNLIQTVLKAGSVTIHRNNAGIFEKDLVLTPNQMASFDKSTQNSKVYAVDANQYAIWTKGLLSFDDLEMCRVLKSLERFYNIQIHYTDPKTGSLRISGKLDLNKDLAEVLEYLSKVSETRFTKIDNDNYQIK